MIDNARQTGAAIEAHYRFVAWMLVAVEKFPRNHKFTVGDRITAICLDVLEALIPTPENAISICAVQIWG